MNRIVADMRAYMKMFMRTRVGPFFTFAFPVLLIVLFGSLFSTEESRLEVFVQDLDHTPSSAGFLEGLNATNLTVVTMIPADTNIESYIKGHSLTAAVLIPAGFNASIASGGPAVITVYGDPTRSSYGMVMGIVGGVADSMNAQLTRTSPIVAVAAGNVASPEFRYMDFFLPGVLGMTVMFTCMYGMGAGVAEYKTRKYFKLIASTPLKKWEWLASKILFYIVIVVLSLVMMFAVAVALFGVRAVPTAAAVLMVVLAVVLFTSMGVIIGAYAKDPESGAAIGNAVGFPMMFLSGSFFPLENAPPTLQAIASIFPLTYVNQGLRSTMIYGNESAALGSIAIVGVMAAVFAVLAARLIRWTRD